MSEEEAIKQLKKHKQEIDKQYISSRYSKAIEVVLNLIQKQSKEIEELKEKNNFIHINNLNDIYEETLEKTFTKFIKSNIEKDYIPKSKVKELAKKYEFALNGYDGSTADYKHSQNLGRYLACVELLKEGE